MAAQDTPRPAIAPVPLRVHPSSQVPGHLGWRKGPTTAEGYWLVTRDGTRAVQIIEDRGAPSYAGLVYDDALQDAFVQREMASVDQYLASISDLADAPPQEDAMPEQRIRLAFMQGYHGSRVARGDLSIDAGGTSDTVDGRLAEQLEDLNRQALEAFGEAE